MYLSYDEYTNMGGTLDKTAFNDLEFEARSQVDYYTFNRLQNETEYPEAVKRVMYKLIQLAEQQQNALVTGNNADGTGNAMVASQSNDGVSTSWNVMSASDVYKTLKDETGKVIKHYLSGVRNSLGHRLLYRGIYPDE